MNIEKNVDMPQPRGHVSRLTEALKNIEVGESVVLDKKTAACLLGYLRHHKKRGIRREVDPNLFRVWRSE